MVGGMVTRAEVAGRLLSASRAIQGLEVGDWGWGRGGEWGLDVVTVDRAELRW